jgi:hypothetical protein
MHVNVDPGTPVPDGPCVEPVEHFLGRVELGAQLLTAPSCRHCHARVEVIAHEPGTIVPRAVAVHHERGCPDAPCW